MAQKWQRLTFLGKVTNQLLLLNSFEILSQLQIKRFLVSFPARVYTCPSSKKIRQEKEVSCGNLKILPEFVGSLCSFKIFAELLISFFKYSINLFLSPNAHGFVLQLGLFRAGKCRRNRSLSLECHICRAFSFSAARELLCTEQKLITK